MSNHDCISEEHILYQIVNRLAPCTLAISPLPAPLSQYVVHSELLLLTPLEDAEKNAFDSEF